MPATPQRSETVSGTAYAVTGSGAPLVLIHGVGMRLEAWAPQIAALSQRFEVIALDLPGHGESRPLRRVRPFRTSWGGSRPFWRRSIGVR